MNPPSWVRVNAKLTTITKVLKWYLLITTMWAKNPDELKYN
jgi:hypothetical protein